MLLACRGFCPEALAFKGLQESWGLVQACSGPPAASKAAGQTHGSPCAPALADHLVHERSPHAHMNGGWERAGVEYRGLPVMAVGDIVAAHVTEPTDEHPDFEPPRLPPVVEQMQEQIEGLRLFVYGPTRMPFCGPANQTHTHKHSIQAWHSQETIYLMTLVNPVELPIMCKAYQGI